MNAKLLALLGATALAAHSAAATTTCPVYVQSTTTSTLTKPITKIVSSTSSDSGSGSTASASSSTGSGSNFADAGSQGSQNTDVGGSSSSATTAGSSGGTSTGTTAGSDDATGSAGVSTTTTPSSTTKTPSTATETPSTTTATGTGTTTGSASTTTTTGSATTAPSTDTTATVTASSGSSTTAAGSTTTLSLGVRKLQATTTTTTGSTTGATGTTGTTSTTTGTTGTTTGTTGTTTGTTGTTTTGTTTTTGSTSTTTTSAGSGSTTGSVGSGSSSSDVLTCDSTFYSKWDTLGLKCGGSGIDVASAVSASSCVIYSGSVGSTSGSTCVSICSFPACTNSAWVYGGSNGISSSVYDGLSIESFLSSEVIAALEERSSTVSTFLSNSTMSDSEQCTYSSESSFSSCTCSAMLIDSDSSGSVADAAKKQQRAQNEEEGVITKDNTTTTGTVVAATSKSVAGVTVAVTGIAAIASTAVGGVSSAGASLAAAGSTMAITTVEICQFGVLVNQLQLDGKSSALAQFGKAMAPAAFTFLPFGKLNDSSSDSSSSGSGSSSTAGRRLSSSSTSGSSSSSSSSDQLTGIAKYSRQLNIQEDMLFLVTLAGVFCVMAGVVGLFGIGYLLSGLMMPREEYLAKFFDKMIGLEVLVAILSQYTIGVTATFQIYYSNKYESITDPKCLLAIAAIIFLAAGILVYGYVVIKKHEAELSDVGTVQHLKKTVNMRYGPLYEEYKFKNRYFFCAKMMLALTTGVVTGCASMSGKVQVSIILALNVLFFFYLEIQSPHHSKFVQTTTSFVSIMKIAVLVLTFFLVTAAASDGFPTSLQNGISVAIVGLNLFVLALLMIRSLYTFWQKFKLQRDAAYDQEEQTAQDYFKDETPATRKDRAPSNAQHPSGQPVLQSQYSNVNANGNNPYVQESGVVDYSSADEIRLRSATHENDNRQQTYDASRQSAANHYITQDRNTYGQRRNDVVEL